MTRDTVFLVDDHPGFRESTQWLLEARDLRVVAYADGASFLAGYPAAASGGARHCLLLDMRMPTMSGLQLQERLRDQGIRVPVVFMTAHGDIPLAVEAMRGGAVDFIEKPFAEEAVLGALQRALSCGMERPAEAADRPDPVLRARYDSLTAREREVCQRVVAGRLNKTIADDLGISIKTVELHRSRVMEKMQAKCVATLVQYTLRASAITP